MTDFQSKAPMVFGPPKRPPSDWWEYAETQGFGVWHCPRCGANWWRNAIPRCGCDGIIRRLLCKHAGPKTYTVTDGWRCKDCGQSLEDPNG